MTEKSDTLDTAGVGNTCVNPRARRWCFTLNNYSTDDDKKLEKYLTHKSKRFIYQAEKGAEGTPHLQGVFELTNASSFKALKKQLGDKLHLEKCNNWNASVKYCQKTEGRLQEPKYKGFRKPLKLIKDLRQWQQDVINNINFSNDRSINWYYDEEGCKGKTQLAKYICNSRNAIYVSGKGNDIKYAITSYILEEETRADELICIFHYTRSVEHFVSYSALEEIKDGIWFNTKYEAKMMMINSPHVIVFANFEPEIEKLSKDRWIVTDLNE